LRRLKAIMNSLNNDGDDDECDGEDNRDD